MKELEDENLNEVEEIKGNEEFVELTEEEELEVEGGACFSQKSDLYLIQGFAKTELIIDLSQIAKPNTKIEMKTQQEGVNVLITSTPTPKITIKLKKSLWAMLCDFSLTGIDGKPITLRVSVMFGAKNDLIMGPMKIN